MQTTSLKTHPASPTMKRREYCLGAGRGPEPDPAHPGSGTSSFSDTRDPARGKTKIPRLWRQILPVAACWDLEQTILGGLDGISETILDVRSIPLDPRRLFGLKIPEWSGLGPGALRLCNHSPRTREHPSSLAGNRN